MSERYYPDRENAPYGVARLGEKYELMEVFDKFPKRERNLPNYYSYFVYAGIGSFGVSLVGNFFYGRALFYKPWLTVGTVLLSLSAVYAGLHYRDRAQVRTMAIVRDYIKLHPERFPPVERKKFKDSLHQWYEERWYS